MGRTTRSFRSASTAGLGLGRVLGPLAAFLSVRQVLLYADAWTQLSNRLKLVTDSTEELIRVQEEVFQIAQGTRTGLSSTAELYARIARSSDQLGLSQRELLDVTESVSQAITISGVSAESANAAIVQLGQGLASGALRGDELRSVLEQTPRLARAIADGLDVPIGRLRELGAEGELTAEKVISALQSQADVLRQEFGQTDPTIGQAFTILENAATRFIGRLNEATGFSATLSRSLISLADDVGGVSDEFFEAAFNVSQFALTVLGEINTLDERFALFRNTVVGTLASLFGDDAVAQAAAEDRIRLERNLEEEEQILRDSLDRRLEDFRDFQETRAASEQVDLAITPDPIAQGPSQDEIDAAEDLREELEKLGDALTEQVQTPFEEFQVQLAEYQTLLDAGTISTETYNRAVRAAAEGYSETLPEIVAYNDQLERGAQLTEDLRTPQEIYTQQLAELNELLGAGAISQETFNRAIAQARDELQEAVAENDQFAQFLEQVSIQAARNIQSAFADFLFDPFDEGLDGLLNSFLDTLKRMAAEALSAQIFELIGGAIGAPAGGGVGGFFGSLFGGGFAAGGDFSGGSPILVGEEGPEIITPRQPGTVLSNDALAAMGQQAAPEVTVPVTINNVTDPEGIVSVLESGAGQQAILNTIQQNPDIIKRQLS